MVAGRRKVNRLGLQAILFAVCWSMLIGLRPSQAQTTDTGTGANGVDRIGMASESLLTAEDVRAAADALLSGEGGRTAGSPRNLSVEDRVAQSFAGSGLQHGQIVFDVPAFQPGHLRLTMPDGQTHTLDTMHPTIFRPGNFTEPTFDAPLVYGGKGRVADFQRLSGAALDGALVLMDFDSLDAWREFLRFNVRGFIFIAPSVHHYRDAADKIYNTEASTPRFLVNREIGLAWRDALLGSAGSDTNSDTASDGDAASAARSIAVRAEATPSRWINQSVRNLWALVPGSDIDLEREVVIVTATMDANAVVPAKADGAEAGLNLVLLMQLLERYRQSPPARSVLLVALNAHTQMFHGERQLAWHAIMNGIVENNPVQEVRDVYQQQRDLQELYAEEYQRLHVYPKLPTVAGFQVDTYFDDADQALLNEMRTLTDESTARRIRVKTPLQDLAKERNNIIKSRMAEVSQSRTMSTEEKESRYEVLRAQREQRTRVLQLFNNIDVGGVRIEYSNLTEIERDLLRDYVYTLLGQYSTWARLNREASRIDLDNGDIYNAIAVKRLTKVIALEMNWRSNAIGFDGGKPGPWTMEFGRRMNTLAVSLDESLVGNSASSAGDPISSIGSAGITDTSAAAAQSLAAADAAQSQTNVESPFGRRFGVGYVDALTGRAGLSASYFLPDQTTGADIYHAARRTPAFALKNAGPGAVSRAFTLDDRLDAIDLGRAARLMNYVTVLLGQMLADPQLTAKGVLALAPATPLMHSTTVYTNLLDPYAIDAVPRQPIVGAAVVIPPGQLKRAFTRTGLDGDVISAYLGMSDERAAYTLVGIIENETLPSAAFKFNDDFTAATHVVDYGLINVDRFQPNLPAQPQKRLMLFHSREIPLGELSSATHLNGYDTAISSVKLLEGVGNSVVQRFGSAGLYGGTSGVQFPSGSGPVSIFVDAPRDDGDQVAVKFITGLLAINSTDEEPEGQGYQTAQELGSDYVYAAVRDTSGLNHFRRDELTGVVNQLVDEFLILGDERIELLDRAREDHQYPAYLKALHETEGLQGKAYREMRSISGDMMQAIVFYMALLIPFCVFLQRLLFKFVRLESQIAAFAVLFTGMYLLFRTVHPAFRLAQAPEAIFVAFVLGMIGAFVVFMLQHRFEGEMRVLFRTNMVQDIGMPAVGQQAMGIGVNNMKRRRIRTTLTTATIVLVTFTMLAFSSVSRTMSPTLATMPLQPAYTGVYYAQPGQNPIHESVVRMFEQLLAGDADLVLRRQTVTARSMPVEASNGSFLRGKAVLGLSQEENGFLDRIAILQGGRYFSSDDAMEVILPSEAAESLGLSSADVGKATITFEGLTLTLVGIASDAELQYMRDLDGMSILPPNREASAVPGGPVGGGATVTAAGATAVDGDSISAMTVPTSGLLILPIDTSRLAGAEYASISARLHDDVEIWPVVMRLLNASSIKFYIGAREPFAMREGAQRKQPAGGYYVGSGYSTSVAGLSQLIIPLLIAGTIVLNTMLGSVFERKKEIEVYNAIGLNPTHIGLFFLAESFVYGVIGSVGGYLIGQFLAIALVELRLVPQLNVNFSSLIVVYVILFTILLVLVSTLYPAWVATRAAVPSGKRRWSMPAHDGQQMQVVFPFICQPRLAPGVMQYLSSFFEGFEEASVGDQIAKLLDRGAGRDETGRPTYSMTFQVSLAPFDLGVSQTVRFDARYADDVESYTIEMTIDRTAGQDINWVTTNKPFLERMRKFLMQWRNIDVTRHKYFVQQARQNFAETESAAG